MLFHKPLSRFSFFEVSQSAISKLSGDGRR